MNSSIWSSLKEEKIMKKLITGLAVFLIAAGVYAGYAIEGAGDTGTATTTPALVIVPGTNWCYAVSIDNGGAVPIRVIKKLESTATTAGFVVAEAMVVPAGKSYTISGGTILNEKLRRHIYGVVIATESGTADYSINFE